MIQEFEAKLAAIQAEREEAARQKDRAALELLYDKSPSMVHTTSRDGVF